MLTRLLAAALSGLIVTSGALGGASQSATSRLAFTSLERGYQLMSMSATGDDVRRVSTTGAAESQGTPSPDGTKIAFVSRRDGNPELYVMSADGSGARRLTNHPAWDGDPDWSPDSLRIAFESERDDSDGDVFVVNADGFGLTKLAGSPDADLSPAWSPDGARIAFESDRDGDSEIYVMATDGTAVTQLTRTRTLDGDRLPDWSPDGTKIVFASDRGTQVDEEIWIMNADGTEPFG